MQDISYRESSNDSICDVANTGLQGEKSRGKSAVLDLVLQELDQVAGDGSGRVILGSVLAGLIGVIGLDDSNDFFGIDGDVGGTDAVFGGHDEIWLPSWRQVGHGDVVQALKAGSCCVDFDDDLVGHLDDLRTGADGSARDDAAVFGNGTGLDNGHVETVVALVLCVKAVHEIDGEHAEMFVEELDVSIVDALGNLLADLMGSSSLDHVEASPSVFGLCT